MIDLQDPQLPVDPIEETPEEREAREKAEREEAERVKKNQKNLKRMFKNPNYIGVPEYEYRILKTPNEHPRREGELIYTPPEGETVRFFYIPQFRVVPKQGEIPPEWESLGELDDFVSEPLTRENKARRLIEKHIRQCDKRRADFELIPYEPTTLAE